MGERIGPSVTCLTVGEEKMLGDYNRHRMPLLLRYIDDIVGAF